MKSTIDVTEANFDAEVLQSTQPVLVDFYTQTCGPCRMLAPVLEEIASEMTGRVKVVKVDASENPGLCARYGIQAVPTLLYVAKGEVQGQTLGAASKKAILTNLNSLLST